MRKKLFKRFLFGCGIFLITTTTVLASGMIAKSAQANDVAPDFTLTGVSGQVVSLKDYLGRGVILFFFTTWCPHCQDKFPILSNEYGSIKKDGLELLVINTGESEAKVKSYARKQSVPFDVFLDSRMETAKAYGVLGVPSFFLVNKEGKLIFQGHELPGNYKDLLKQ